jgi:integrase
VTHSTLGDSRPQKPHPDFPLYAHKTRRWAKKVKGRTHFFGRWEDPQGALERWLETKDDLLAGRRPRPKGGLTVRDLCNQFLDAKRRRVETGELAEITWHSYWTTCKLMARFLGDHLVTDLRADDLARYRAELAKTRGLVSLADKVNRSSIVLTWAYKTDLIDKPIKFGDAFAKPSAKAIRQQRTPRMYEAAELRQMIEAAAPVTRAQILLGLNAGLSCTDIGRLPINALNLDTAWLVFARVKTGTERRIPLWPETVLVIRQAITLRPKPAKLDWDTLLFLRPSGIPWQVGHRDRFSPHFSAFLKTIGLHRPKHGYYTLRHVFETVAGESRDQVAVDAIMGHERGDMASAYRERISDERLKDVVETVREWLYAEPTEESEPDILKFSTQSKIG